VSGAVTLQQGRIINKRSLSSNVVGYWESFDIGCPGGPDCERRRKASRGVLESTRTRNSRKVLFFRLYLFQTPPDSASRSSRFSAVFSFFRWRSGSPPALSWIPNSPPALTLPRKAVFKTVADVSATFETANSIPRSDIDGAASALFVPAKCVPAQRLVLFPL
jgi:hypothetical protein